LLEAAIINISQAMKNYLFINYSYYKNLVIYVYNFHIYNQRHLNLTIICAGRVKTMSNVINHRRLIVYVPIVPKTKIDDLYLLMPKAHVCLLLTTWKSFFRKCSAIFLFNLFILVFDLIVICKTIIIIIVIIFFNII